jgi:hypothetical protein
MDLTPEEQALIDGAGENKDLAIYLIKRDRAADALRALDDLEAMAGAIRTALERDDDDEDDEDDDYVNVDQRLNELISYLQEQ